MKSLKIWKCEHSIIDTSYDGQFIMLYMYIMLL